MDNKLPGGPMARRPLHFIWICDCSGSMAGDKIGALNYAIRSAIPAMQTAAEDNPNAEVLVRCAKFSDDAQWHVAHPTPVADFKWSDLRADGVTELGKALVMVADQLMMPPMTERGLPPVLVLISDGQPTDDFNSGLKALMDQPWGKRSVRIAIAVGHDADQDVLQKFIGHPEMKPLQANNAETLVRYIKWASTAVLKSASAPRNQTEDAASGAANVPIPIPPAADDPTGDVWDHIVRGDEVRVGTVRVGEIQGGNDSGTDIAIGHGASARVTQKVTCHFHAEIDTEVIVNRVTTVEVIVSREQIGRIASEAAKTGQAVVDLQKRLIIQVIPKENFETVDEGRVEIDPPEPGALEQCYFDVRPTHLGQGELWVIARQGQVSLITLELHSRIVQTKSAATQRVTVEAASPEAPILQAPLHQLRIFELHNGGEYSYLYELLSPALDILRMFRSSPLMGDRRQYVENLYRTIERRWFSHQDDIPAFSAELRAFGGHLWDQLFPETLQHILWEHRDQLNSIMVISTEPFIPWELVHLKQPGRPQLPNETRFLGQMGMVRWLHDVGWPPDQIKIRRGQVHYVIPHYPDPRYRLPQAERESQFLQEQFAATALTPQPIPVCELLSQPGAFDLLHFACHGSAEQDNISNAQLLLEGRMEKGEYIPAYLQATVAEQFGHLRTDENRPMIVLNACQVGREGYSLTGLGGFAQAFLRAGAGAFIGTLWSVGDSPARSFTETLYSELRKGLNLAEATIQARDQARQAGDATWLAYAVYGHPHMRINHVKISFPLVGNEADLIW